MKRTESWNCITVIPDVHGRTFWKEAISRFPNEPIVFLGDYLDPYPSENISPEAAIDNFLEIIDAARANPNIHLLLGNHDLHYLYSTRTGGCRMDLRNRNRIHDIFFKNTDLFSLMFTARAGDRLFTFSHAPVLEIWLENTGLPHDIEVIESTLNRLASGMAHPAEFSILEHVHYMRGGYNVAGSPVWADRREVSDYGARVAEYTGYNIFGHTGGNIPYITETWACLDCRKAFILKPDGTIEPMGKSAYVPSLSSRVEGCLVAGAAGDALGYPVEFIYSFNNIAKKYGISGITSYDYSNDWSNKAYDTAQISDDTQMTLYTIEGILEAKKQGRDIVHVVTEAYLNWLEGQTGIHTKHIYDSELLKVAELNQRRAPGNTCISALRTISADRDVMNSSKGCGGIMRVAPIGLYGAIHDFPLTTTAIYGGDIAEITHQHPLSTYASAAMAAIVQLCVQADEPVTDERFKVIVEKALETVKDIYGQATDMFVKLMRYALTFKDDPRPDWQVIEESLGEGWTAEETLAIALFCVQRHLNSVHECLIAAVNHGGDSDSTGAVAGNIIGAILGAQAIPASLTDRLQLHDLIKTMGAHLIFAN